MTGRSRFRFRFRGVMSLVKSIASQFFDILQKEEAASNTNVFYDPSDLGSLFVSRKTEAKSTTVEGNPSVGDAVGTMMDTSQMGGKTADEYIAENAISVTGLAQGALNISGYNGDVSDDLSASFSVGDYIVIKFTISNYTGGVLQIGTGNQGTITNRAFTISTNGTYYKLWKATDTNIQYRAANGFVGTFSLDVVAKIPGHHAIAPSDSARPVLFDDPDLTAAALTDNGRGEELLEGNVTWSTADGSWTETSPGDFTAVNGINFGANSTQLDDLTEIGAEYEVSLEVYDYVSGTLGARIRSNNQTDLSASGNGVFTGKARATEAIQIYLMGWGLFNGKVRNISVRKVLTAFDERGGELTTGSLTNIPFGATLDGSLVTFTSQYGNANDTVTGLASTGGVYEITITAKAISGNTNLHFYHENMLEVGAAGAATYTAITVPTDRYETFKLIVQHTVSSLFRVGIQDRNTSGFGTVDVQSISCKQLSTPNLLWTGGSDDDSTFDTDTGNWSKGTGWSIGSGVASASGGANLAYLNIFTLNKWYSLTFYMSAYTSGTLYAGTSTTNEPFNSTGWKTTYFRADNTGLYFVGLNTFTGSIDNVSVQELPASINRKYYLDTDGSDDWMEVKPTLNLGEQWWHTGAWISDSSAGKRPFATSNNYQGAPRDISGNWVWYDPSSVAQIICTSNPSASKHVLTIEQADTNSLVARFNGVQEADPITPYDDSAVTQGVALFSQQNNLYANGWNGRFYGGSWGQGQVDYDELTVLQDYLGTTTQPPIDPPDVTEYADVYELLSAQTGAVLFDINDKTSLRVGRDGSGGVPVDGDPVGMMLDVSDTGGATVAAATAARPELVTNGTFDTDSDWTKGTGWTISGGVLTASSGSYGFSVYQNSSWTAGVAYEITADVTVTAGTLQVWVDAVGTKIADVTATGTLREIFVTTNSSGRIIQLTSSSFEGTIDNISVKKISSHAAIAPSDSARPTLASVLDTTASELTDNGTRGEAINSVTSYGSSGGTENGLPFEQGATYEITFTVEGRTAGTMKPQFTGGVAQIGTPVATNDTHTETLTATNNANFQMVAGGGFDGTVSNISVRKVNTVFDERGPELVDYTGATLSAESSVAGDLITVDGDATVNIDTLASSIVAGKTYEVEVTDVTKIVPAGSTFQLRVKSSGGGSDFSSVAINNSASVGKILWTATTSGNLQLRWYDFGGGGRISCRISVKEVLTPNLNPSADGQTYNYTAAGQNNDLTDHAFTASAWYRLSGYIENYSSGSLQIGLGDYAVQDASINSNGWFDVYLRATGAGALLRLRSAGGGATFDLSNFKSQEVPASVARAFYLDFDGSDDNLILDADTIAASSNATLYKTFRGDTTDTQQIMFAPASGPWILVADAGNSSTSTSTNVGSPIFRQDGLIKTYATWINVFSELIDNTDHTIGAEEVNISLDSRWVTSGFYIGGELGGTYDSTGRLYAWAAVDTRLDGRGRDLLENFMIGKKTS